MANFIYLFRGSADMRTQAPAEMQKQMERWRGWMQQLTASGNFKAGEPLERGGKTVAGKKKVITDGPYAEAKDLVGGYLVVAAESLDHAVELAKGCPIFEHEHGSVEVRPVAQM